MRVDTVEDFMYMNIEPSFVNIKIMQINVPYGADNEVVYEGSYGDMPNHLRNAELDSWSLYHNVITLNCVL